MTPIRRPSQNRLSPYYSPCRFAPLGPRSAGAAVSHGDGNPPERLCPRPRNAPRPCRTCPFPWPRRARLKIRNSGADSIVELARNVAGLSIADLGPGQSQIAIRGISSGQVIREPTGREGAGGRVPGRVADLGRPVHARPRSVRPRSLRGARGPQGTLSVAGSESGTLRYITNRPDSASSRAIVEATGDASTTGDGGGRCAGW